MVYAVTREQMERSWPVRSLGLAVDDVELMLLMGWRKRNKKPFMLRFGSRVGLIEDKASKDGLEPKNLLRFEGWIEGVLDWGWTP
jgi:hypothetical protein